MRGVLPAHRAFFFSRWLSETYCAAAQTPRTQVGETFSCTRTFAPEEVSAFLALTGDTNHIHTSTEAAASQGLQGAILPGILCASLFPAIIGRQFPGALYLSQTLKFRQPVLVGTQLRASVQAVRVSGNKVLFDTVCTAEGTSVVDGTALALLEQP